MSEPDNSSSSSLGEFLDARKPLEVRVGYGSLGTGGSLGFDNRYVSVKGRRYSHALSTHGPASVLFELDEKAYEFNCSVAINDGVPEGISKADFLVAVDGNIVAAAFAVSAGDPPCAIAAVFGPSQKLELRVEAVDRAFCQAVWLDPTLSAVPEPHDMPQSLTDCLGRTKVFIPSDAGSHERCIATIATKGFETLLDDMLGSLVANGGCPDALLAVFCVGDPSSIAPVAAKYRALLISCDPLKGIDAAVKGAVYSAARVIQAEQFLCLDADMLVLQDLDPIFSMIRACPDGSILTCREAVGKFRSLAEALVCNYGATLPEAAMLLDPKTAIYDFVVNSGLFAGARNALIALDSQMRAMMRARDWMERSDCAYADQFLFNLALAQSNVGVELDSTYNLQLQAREVRMSYEAGRVQAKFNGKNVSVLHFNGSRGRNCLPEWRNLFARINDAATAQRVGPL